MSTRLTNNKTSTGKLGICRIPSNSIGNEAPAASAAGSMRGHVLLGPKLSGKKCSGPGCGSFPVFIFEDLDRVHKTVVYASRIARKEWQASASADGC